MMESTNASNDLQTPPTIPIINSSSRRKQSKPNRLEHIALETSAPVAESITPSLTQYHVAAEQQQESAYVDDESDQISLNCEDGSLSSHSPDGNYAIEDIANRSRRSSHSVSRSNDKVNPDENVEQMLTESNDQQEEQIHSQSNNSSTAILDFSLKLDDTNKNLFNSTNRPRSLNPNGKSRSGKRKHQNGNIDGKQSTLNAPTRIFHADAFCSICRKEFCNKYFLKTHLANKHGIFDPQTVGSSLSAPTMLSLQGVKDLNSDSSLQHSYTMVSALLQNGQEDFSPSTSSDLIENHQNNDDDENESELGSLKHQMNGVIAGDEDHQPDDDQNNNNNDVDDDDDEDDDEQDGSDANRLMNLPQQIASILRNDNLKRNSLSMLNDNDNMDDDEDDDNDQQENANNSPTNSLDYQQQQQQATSSQPTPSTSILTTPTSNISRQNSTKSAEDFCDICQKHFCNKYYLRKHKLDVHGVQTDCNIKPYKRIDSSSLANKNSSASSSAQQIPSSIQLPNAFSNVTFNASSVQQSLGMLLNPIFSPLVQSQNNSDSCSLSSNKRRYTDNSNESSSSSSVNAATLTKSQFPPSLLSVASDVAHAFANQLASVANNSTSSATSAIVASTASTASGGKSQISTCHLCGKKFQSNDYLQLHLMNKHQISTDLQTLESLEQRNRTSNLIKSSNGSLNSSTVKKIKLETNETPSTAATTTSIRTSTPSTPTDAISPALNAAVIPGIVDTYFAAKMADRVSCNICHKQVCNKYFLKTHKLKVHGVGPDSTVTSSSSNLLNNGDAMDDLSESQQQSRSSFDGSPPQLIVDEMNSVNNEPGVIPSPDALTASVTTCIGTNNHANSNSSNDSIEPAKTSICEICSQSFPTKFLHVHMNNAHGIQQAPIIVNGVTSTKTTIVPGTLKRSMSNGNGVMSTNISRLKQTPQVQLRVTCQVCKKELCNKYFLRAHMRNVHNISVDDLRFIQPGSQQSNSSQLSPVADSPSSKTTFSLSSNLLSSTSNNITDSNQTSANQLSSLNDNESNNFNGHTTDSNDSENLNLSKEMNQFSSSLATSFKSATNDNNNNNNRVLSMQPFLVESDDDLYKDLFVPCMVYLPCRHRVTKPLEISLRLKPVDNNNTTGAATATTSTATIAD